MTVLTPEHPQFPLGLIQSELFLPQLFCKGETLNLSSPLISIVGSRRIYPWVAQWMEREVLPVLIQQGVGVVSGGARGVDQWAHSLAQRAQVPNVAVLPSGLGHIYPNTLRGFGGNLTLLTEYSFDEPMHKKNFHRRNQLIAAFNPLLLVVQAAEKSGTMITARAAIEAGRQVAVVPSDPLDREFTGSNQLLFEGAHMLRDQKDLLSLIGSLY